MDAAEELKRRVVLVNKKIEAFLPREEGNYAIVAEAMNYSVRNGGKRLRPILMGEVARLFDAKPVALSQFMAAMEMIHSYSLVHDDLPAMDNDLLRRGKPTTHAKFGHAMGILAGDGLLNRAYEVAIGSLDVARTADEFERITKALHVLSQNAGIFGMIGGQVMDVEAESMDDVTDEYLIETYALKTGALLSASMVIGAILAGATDEQVEIVESLADKIGLAFQVQDDILDVSGDEKKLGKTVGSDQLNDKTTMVTLHGLEACGQMVRALTNDALALLYELPGDKELLAGILEWMVYREI